MHSYLLAVVVGAVVGLPVLASDPNDDRLKAALAVAEKLVADSPNDANCLLYTSPSPRDS